MNISHSIWNENPVIYVVVKRIWALLAGIIYPFAHFCVLTKSPKKCGYLKWVVYLHCFWITCEWLSGSFLIDIFDFQPSVTIRVDGLLNNVLDPVLLYTIYICVDSLSSTSALILFTSRIFMIMNMYRQYLSHLRIFCELMIYVLVVIFGLWTIPTAIWSIPDQTSEKLKISQDGQPYPDCLWDDNVVAVFDSGSQSEHLVSILTILNWVSCGIAIFVAAKIAFFLLAKRMVNESKATRRMNKKFNQRTILQAFIFLFFSCVPFTVLHLTIIFGLYIPGITYFIDIFSENHPTACVVALFLFYDPYQIYLFKIIGWNPKHMSKTSTSATFVVLRN
ncbi:Serpentine Receptor, class H [Caenorhabditis elegans]|uniref:Serpentine Receptor, class H n=1 Tax=Caenorhabditis elegans TaxID=6239 RepID=Q966I5_CAEEL|nr:Serpentine Receptor, class H [Caenorhabditis elegans]CCD62242.1 Serpentine Receptor, class H [Caenorhabditis elegans]|eukprot:NP_503203.1 Serpentine Receptor, class H [Caenorhabditis elegans]